MKYYFSVDVESVGLWGPPFQVGYCVVDETGEELENGLYGFDYNDVVEFLLDQPKLKIFDRWDFTREDVDWVRKNIPLIQGENVNRSSMKSMMDCFYGDWNRCKAWYENLTMVSDCPLPCEFNFLLDVLAAHNHRDMEQERG